MYRSRLSVLLPLSAAFLLAVAGCSKKPATPESAPAGTDPAALRSNAEETQAMVLLRGLPTLDTNHSVAIVELDPESANFGAILQEFELPDLELPLHHLYYSPNGRLYATGLDPKCSLAEVGLSRDAAGAPVIEGVS